MTTHTFIVLAASVFVASIPAAAEGCGKNPGSIMSPFRQRSAPTFSLGEPVSDAMKFDGKTDFASLVLAAATQDVSSISLTIANKTVALSPCELQVAGKPGLRGFQVASRDASRLAELVRKNGAATLQIRWRNKQNEAKVYLAQQTH